MGFEARRFNRMAMGAGDIKGAGCRRAATGAAQRADCAMVFADCC